MPELMFMLLQIKKYFKDRRFLWLMVQISTDALFAKLGMNDPPAFSQTRRDFYLAEPTPFEMDPGTTYQDLIQEKIQPVLRSAYSQSLIGNDHPFLGAMQVSFQIDLEGHPHRILILPSGEGEARPLEGKIYLALEQLVIPTKDDSTENEYSFRVNFSGASGPVQIDPSITLLALSLDQQKFAVEDVAARTAIRWESAHGEKHVTNEKISHFDDAESEALSRVVNLNHPFSFTAELVLDPDGSVSGAKVTLSSPNPPDDREGWELAIKTDIQNELIGLAPVGSAESPAEALIIHSAPVDTAVKHR